MPYCRSIKTKLSEVTQHYLFNCLSLVMNRLTPLDPCLSSDTLSNGLQYSNYEYGGNTASYGFRQWDEEEKWRNASTFVG